MQETSDIQARFRHAMDLYELAEAMVRQRLRRQEPDADEAQVEAGVRAWRLRRPGAEDGDSPGRLVTWQRP